MKFVFVSTDKDMWTGATDGDVSWTKPEQAKWRDDFLAVASDFWTQASLCLFCQRDFWESLVVRPVFAFVEDPADAFYSVLVKKIPVGKQLQSLTIPPDLHGPGQAGPVDLDSEGLRFRPNEAKCVQRAAIHETGHMLGLGDEYEGINRVAHADLVQKNVGIAVPIKDDDRIMSRGERTESEHGVTFLEAFREATRMQEWNVVPKRGRRIPYDPARINDLPAAKRGTAYG
jgi:hypothetical protein